MKKFISVVGLGYVGLPLSLLADEKGYQVHGIDINPKRIASLKKGISGLGEPEIDKQLKKSQISFATDFSAVANSDIIIICVPTPVHENNMPDLRPVEGACEGIAPYLKKGQLVILESTVNPGISESVVKPTIEANCNLKVGIDVHLAHCPERINPGDKRWTVKNINRVVGSTSEKGLEIAYNFYSSIVEADIKKMGSIQEAEAVKIVENSFRDINIAFINELAKSFSRLGIDVVNVIEGAATKPFAFMAHYPGCGVGGHCIPVDPYYLIEYAKQNGFEHRFLTLARKINESMPEFTVDTLGEALNEVCLSIKNTHVGVLGIAYKANVPDRRESPAYKVIELLKAKGAIVHVFDPHVLDESTEKTLEDILKKSKALVITTNHNEFKVLDPKTLNKHDIKVVVDGRNCLDKKAFINDGSIIYKGIGR